MPRTVASASAALRWLVVASSRPSILSRAVSSGPVLYRRPDLSIHRFPVSGSFPLALDLSRGYAGGRRVRIPSDEEPDFDEEEIRKDEYFGSDEEETFFLDNAEDVDPDEEDFSGESTEKSD